jgi:hypothetical protein
VQPSYAPLQVPLGFLKPDMEFQRVPAIFCQPQIVLKSCDRRALDSGVMLEAMGVSVGRSRERKSGPKVLLQNNPTDGIMAM